MTSNIFFSSLFLLTIFSSCNFSNKSASDKEQLKEIFNALEQIKSAKYLSTHTLFVEYDTINPVFHEQYYYKEYTNPADTIVGASFIQLFSNDTIKMRFCYDGYMRARVHWEEHTMEIDSFKTQRKAHGTFGPFFTRAKTMIKYILETDDSVSIETKVIADTIRYTFIIYGDMIDFSGNLVISEPEYQSGNITKHSLWINKSSNLPFRIKNEIPFDIGEIKIETCRNPRFGNEYPNAFVASDYFPDFPLRRITQKAGNISDLEGKTAPNWKLVNTDEDTISLEIINAKIILMQFTGIGCGSCFASIPFLKQLKSEFGENDFQLLSIETWQTRLNNIKNHHEKHSLNYMYLLSDKSIRESYFVDAVPVFLLLDENRTILKVFEGYATESTDRQIRNAINEMI